ncbi:hypothetical protein BJ508DRAFT_37963 [Ascobolus immersus RN42]|uniref:Uncharacterized protein n=1 Tax=Ascobolus immersus RN42 TaxID=1160509 RepID=A0A3N4IF33_ASCIM|nr:hypothetical protein BJ508DRAFT_37963 [Ascobolus immersus RN42]
MARPDQTPQPPPQPMPPRQTGNPIDMLTAMHNLVFKQISDVFVAPHRKQPRAAMNYQVKCSIPAALDRFHLALDVLEIEIVSTPFVYLDHSRQTTNIANNTPPL